MVAIQINNPIVDAIYDYWYREKNDNLDDERLRCSNFGNPCDRSLWYAFRWVSPKQMFEGRMLRLFDTGKREEVRLIEDLRAIGCVVQDIDPETGEQFTVSWLDGLFGGSLDGVVSNVLGAEKTPHVLEAKTHNENSFLDLIDKGVEQSKPLHFVQMQLYMHGRGLTRALYIAKNKNTDALHVERVKYNPVLCAQQIARAEAIINSARPPERVESFMDCNYRCNHKETCRPNIVKKYDYDSIFPPLPRVNCRTCMFSDIRNGKFYCGSTGEELSINDQRKACKSHRYIDAIVPGKQFDANKRNMTISYELQRGSVWVDGRDEKPSADDL